jgi:uncharacterized protein (DUF1499 family)
MRAISFVDEIGLGISEDIPIGIVRFASRVSSSAEKIAIFC